MTLFDGFAVTDVETPRGNVRARVGGSGPPILLLHGWPETHLMWHAVAPRLAERFTVVAPDLPGYGDSFRPPVTWPATIAAGASPTGWRSTIRRSSRVCSCSTSSPRPRCGRARTR
jgi:pimeloyl-ACP methyl ester carboxylesterase